MILALKIIGWFFISLAVFHAGFPRYFKWKTDLAALSLINRQMMQTHTFFIALLLILIGLLCITSPVELTTTPLGKRICLGLGFFWLVRVFFQFFGYSTSLWKGKRFETTVHILFAVIWTSITVVFLKIGLQL